MPDPTARPVSAREKRYIPSLNARLKFTTEQDQFLTRRTSPFLTGAGSLDRPLSLILKEVYVQGLRDAADALEHRMVAHD